jgi:hypothetical protein
LGKRWEKITLPPVKVQRNEPTTPEGCNRTNGMDYPEFPPLNCNCHEDNIHQTILAEYDCMWPRKTYLELYFRVYHSISSRIIQKIARKGLKDANNDKYDEANIVEKITSYLPSGLPVDRNGMRKIANGLVEIRKKRRLDEEAQLQKEKELMEISRCLICRGIKTVLQSSEIEEEINKTKRPETTINEAMKTTKRAITEKRKGVISRMDVDEV